MKQCKECIHNEVCRYCGLSDDTPCDFREVASADVVPVRHAKWIPEEHEDRVSSTMTHKYTWYYCSECGRRLVGYSKLSDAQYCHCGARMDLKEESHDTEEE